MQRQNFKYECKGMYTPYVAFSDGPQHHGMLNETVSLSCAKCPQPKMELQYRRLKSKMSAPQIDAVRLALDSMDKLLPSGDRQGFFLGDGAGVGKGREIAGMICEQFYRGRKKALWISCSPNLYLTSMAEIRSVSTGDDNEIDLAINVQSLSEFGYGTSITGNGVLFLTYTMLTTKSRTDGSTRLDQIQKWIDEKFDGLIVLDECHRAKKFDDEKCATETGKQVFLLQEIFRNARVLYSSATGISDIRHFSYMTRLGIFGKGTSYETFDVFVKKLNRRGTAALELVSVEMKMRGIYISRVLSMEGVEMDSIECSGLSATFYNECCLLWNIVLVLVRRLLSLGQLDHIRPHYHNPGLVAMSVWGTYWSAHQRFFAMLILASKIDTAVEITKQEVNSGKSVVIGIQNTGEAQAKNVTGIEMFSAARVIFETTVLEICQMDLSECEITKKRKLEKTQSEDSFVSRWSMENMEIKQIKAKLVDLYFRIKNQFPINPLDDLLQKLGGPARVAELTGRTSRPIKASDGSIHVEERSTNDNSREINLFMTGQKHIAIISEACSTGISLHDKDETRTQLGVSVSRQRVHLTLQLSWSADRVVQQLGRTNRSHQRTKPKYVMVISEIPAERRFLSCISQRLQVMGALTQGDRNAGFSNYLPYEFHTDYGRDSIKKVCRLICDNHEKGDDLYPIFKALTFLDTVSWNTKGPRIKPTVAADIDKFLNRLLGVPIWVQDDIFELIAEEMTKAIRKDKDLNKLDNGIKDMVFGLGTKIHMQSREDIRVFHGQVVSLLKIDIDQSLKWGYVLGLLEKANHSKKKNMFLLSPKRLNSNVQLCLLAFPNKQEEESEISYTVYRPNLCAPEKMYKHELAGYKPVEITIAKNFWNSQYLAQTEGQCSHAFINGKCDIKNCDDGVPKFTITILTGALTTVWDAVNSAVTGSTNGKLQIGRVHLKDEKIVGIHIPSDQIDSVRNILKLVKHF